MRKAARFVYLLLKKTFLISLAGILLGLAIGTEYFLGSIFGIIGFYGTILTVNLFFIHIVLVILNFVSGNSNSDA